LALVPVQQIIAYGQLSSDNSSSNSEGYSPSLIRVVANSPPTPPIGERRSVASPQQIQAANFIANVPKSTWAFGCSPTAASMIAGYYDRTSYPNMYAGPTNSGVFPLDNTIWGTDVISGEVRALNPLSATRDGLDGRSGYGHVDDYWISWEPIGVLVFDPFRTGGWTEHTHGDCTADFMKTSQYNHGLPDGWTTFSFLDDGGKTTDSVLEFYNAHHNDGGYGLKLFYESRGYTVNTMFNQMIYGYGGNTLGFTWEQFKDQIDKDNPVLIFLDDPNGGHSVTAIGYNDSGQIMYIHDTWDHGIHSMTWGGSYAGFDHLLVTVIELDPPPACSAQTHHTITVDGALVDWCRDTEQLEVDTRPVGPFPGDQKLLFTWDASNFCLAWDGANWNFGSDLWVYFYSRTGQGTTNSISSSHTLPQDPNGDGADHALLVSGTNPPVYTYYDWTGSWSPDVSFTGAISITGDQTEILIPRAELGIITTETLSLLAFSDGDGNGISWSSFPTSNPIGTAFKKLYQWQTTGVGITPKDYNIVGEFDIYFPMIIR